MEKQQVFAALYENVTQQESPLKGLLLRGDASDLQQGEKLLLGAVQEGKSPESGVSWLLAASFLRWSEEKWSSV